MKNQLEKFYDKFNVDERVNLTLAAMARNDQEEMDKLYRTCPTRNYSQIDFIYIQKMNGLYRIASVFSEICQHFIYKIDLSFSCIAAFRLAAEGFKDGLLSVVGQLDETHAVRINQYEENQTELVDKLEEIHKQHIIYLQSVYEGLRQFCTHEKIEMNDVIKYSKLDILHPTISQTVNYKIGLNEELVASTINCFNKLWKS
jgi:hypothetical protein